MKKRIIIVLGILIAAGGIGDSEKVSSADAVSPF